MDVVSDSGSESGADSDKRGPAVGPRAPGFATILAALQDMEPADMELVLSRALLKRVDTKFVLSVDQAAGLLASLNDDFSVVLSAGQRIAHYLTRYHDTEDLALYNMHRRGVRPRLKFRVRRYVERDLVYCELKRKDVYGRTSKVRSVCDDTNARIGDDEAEALRKFSAVDPENLAPDVDIDFWRVTLVGRESNERITLDFGYAAAIGDRSVSFPGAVIAELKQPRFQPRSPGMLAFRALHVRPQRLSKYCVAIASLREDARPNRFKPVLRTLSRYAHD